MAEKEGLTDLIVHLTSNPLPHDLIITYASDVSLVLHPYDLSPTNDRLLLHNSEYAELLPANHHFNGNNGTIPIQTVGVAHISKEKYEFLLKERGELVRKNWVDYFAGSHPLNVPSMKSLVLKAANRFEPPAQRLFAFMY